MKKIFVMSLLLVFIVMLTGCGQQDVLQTVKDEVNSQEDYYQQKATAQQIVSQAQEEFFQDVPSVADKGLAAGDVAVSKWDVKEYIIGYAFEAYNTGDDSKLINYLQEQGLYDKYLQIAEKYNLEAQQNIIHTRPTELAVQSVSQSFFDNFMDGDIFTCYGGGSSSSSKLIGFFIPGTWKHAGMMDTLAPDPNAPILSASDQTTSGFCVGYETKAKWAGEASVMALRVYGRTDTNARAAVNYARQFIGYPYNVFVSRTSNDSWYCSKVVYRGWLSQGINVEPTPWFTDPWVTPTDLVDDNDTYYIGGDLN